MLWIVETKVRHLLIHDAFQRDLGENEIQFIFGNRNSRVSFAFYLEFAFVQIENTNLAFAQNSEIKIADRAN